MNSPAPFTPETPTPNPSHDALLNEIPQGRREFVKRLLVKTAVGMAVMTSLYVPEVMADGGKRSPAGYD